jgi:hypothetical protein
MRTNIEIDDELMGEAFKASEATTKRGVVEEGLRLLVKSRSQQGIWNLVGKVDWDPEYDYKAMRGKDPWEGPTAAVGKVASLSKPSKDKVKRSGRKQAA